MIFPERFQLTNKIAVVAGGAGLIGSQICRALAEAGSKVYIADINQAEGKKLQDNLMATGLDVSFIRLDITSEKLIDSSIRQIILRDGKIDIWVNSAYPQTQDWGEKFEKVKLASLRKNIDMHMNGYFLSCQKVLREMKKRKSGVLINLGSIYGVLAPNFSLYEGTDMTMPAAYSLIKGGIVNFSKYLATYYAPYNIRVNAVCPGGVLNSQNKKFIKKYVGLTPLRRMANPKDIAGPVLFLSSESASYITGQVIMVDGGWSAW